MYVEIEKVTKVYQGSTVALDGVDLTIGPGTTGLLGANGAGKTTLLRLLAGVIRPDSGRIVVAGHDLATAAGRAAVKRMLGYLPQELALYPDLTGREFLDYIALLKGIDDKGARRRQTAQLLAEVGLEGAASQRISRYSGGMKRRLGIAQVLLGDPRLIIVDEPTTGLDPEERMRFRALLGGLGADRIVILSTHILDDVAQSCPMVAVLAEGRLLRHGATTGLVEVAAGQTHLVDSATAPAGDFTVVNVTTTGTGALYRVVGAAPPGARPAAPTLDDGYVALLRSARQSVNR